MNIINGKIIMFVIIILKLRKILKRSQNRNKTNQFSRFLSLLEPPVPSEPLPKQKQYQKIVIL